MDIVEQAPVVEPAAPVVESAGEDDSLAAHESEFGTGPKPAPTDDEPSAPVRHRAKSQYATADDVVQINTLTRQLREKEAELEKAKPGALSGSPRLRALQRQIKAIEAELAPAQAPKPAPVPRQAETIPTARYAPPPAQGSGFTEPKPKIEDFASEEDPYEAKVLAVARWERRKEQFEYQQQVATQQTEAGRRAGLEERAQIARTAQAQLQTFAGTKPDFQSVTATFMERQIPNALIAALISSDKYGELVYALAQQPDLADEFVLQSAGKEPTDDLVALLQRRLTARLLAVKTGAAAASLPQPPAPRPPTPVRTGPMLTGQEPPSDESSLADHEKFYGKKRTR